ncbi:hypothetical protein GCM10009565_71220 [Amycolatopsis albidoflavus]
MKLGRMVMRIFPFGESGGADRSESPEEQADRGVADVPVVVLAGEPEQHLAAPVGDGGFGEVQQRNRPDRLAADRPAGLGSPPLERRKSPGNPAARPRYRCGRCPGMRQQAMLAGSAHEARSVRQATTAVRTGAENSRA